MRLFSFLILSVIMFYACDNDLDIIEEPRDIPVVYGFLSLSDTAQYIRLERAFVDENISALELAMNPDSLYYPNAQVSLRRDASGELFDLEMVDGNLEGYVRDSGAFAQSPNYLYKIKSDDIDLRAGEMYSLVIQRTEDSETIEAETRLIGPTEIKSPNSQNAVILDFDYVDLNLFIWQASEGASVHDLFFRFNYRERSPETNNQFVSKSVLWKAGSNIEEEDVRVDYEFQGLNFYTFLSGAIPVETDVQRRFENMDMIVVSGGTEILDFVNVSSANLGITSTQDVPSYTNIPEGRGIFSSRYTTELNTITLSNQTIDSLVNGSLTSQLNFIN